MNLIEIGGNECGLDLDVNGPCVMETCGLVPDFRTCRVAQHKQALLDAVRKDIRFFPATHMEGLSYHNWAYRVYSR